MGRKEVFASFYLQRHASFTFQSFWLGYIRGLFPQGTDKEKLGVSFFPSGPGCCGTASETTSRRERRVSPVLSPDLRGGAQREPAVAANAFERTGQCQHAVLLGQHGHPIWPSVCLLICFPQLRASGVLTSKEEKERDDSRD